MRTNYTGIVRDHSGSMQGHRRHAAEDYTQVVAAVRDGSHDAGIHTLVSVVKCGVGYDGRVEVETENAPVTSLVPLRTYSTDGGSTPLWDSTGKLIEIFRRVPADDETSFLIMVITDGQENASRRWSGVRLAEEIRALQATDRWSFTFRVPQRYGKELSRRLGIPEGNILEWDTMSSEALRMSTASTVTATAGYFRGLSQGVRSTGAFYANIAHISTQDLKQQADEITDRVVLWTVDVTNAEIRPFVQLKSGKPYVRGTAFYSLVKDETVQDSKELAIRDRNSGKVFSGRAVRNMLGLPLWGSVRLKPGNHGQYELFVQSASVNRKLPYGSKVMLLVR